MTLSQIATEDELSMPNGRDLAMLVGQVWTSFFGETVTPHDSVALDAESSNIVADHRAVASVSISGPWSGHLTLAMAQDGAEAAAAALFELLADEIGMSEIADAMGELANVVGGNVKAMLPEPSTLSLPQVVVDAHAVSLFSARLECAATVTWRDFPIEVSLWKSVRRQPLNS